MRDVATRLSLLIALSLGGCGLPLKAALPADLAGARASYSSPTYADPAKWLCLPDRPGDACRSADLTATEMHPDGGLRVVAHTPAKDPKVDCFYVYPTVDMGLFAGNHESFDDLEDQTRVAVAQAARFTEACAVYAPLYRQVTIGTYLASEETREARLEVAFSDVADAFLHYLGQHNHGRKIVLLGHSQGADMVVRLLQQFFDHDPALRERLLLAMPIGGNVEVAKGKTTGGAFDTVPICTAPGDIGCVIAYRSHPGGYRGAPKAGRPHAGNEAVCVDPASGAREGYGWFSRAYFPVAEAGRSFVREPSGVTTPFVMLRDFYSGGCADGEDDYRYLAVWATPRPRDLRVSPVDFDSPWLQTSFGLHVLDLQIAQGDLIDRVARAARALGQGEEVSPTESTRPE